MISSSRAGRGTRLPARFRARAIAAVTLLASALLVSAVPVAAGAPSITLTTILDGYLRPVLVTHTGAPNRRIFIVEQGGRIRIATFKNGAWRKVGTFLDIRSKVNDPAVDNSEQGLLGLAFHPDYATNGRFYVNYTRKGSGAKHGDTVIAEYRRAKVDRADPTSARTVMVIPQPYPNHNGGHLLFGDDDLLYIFTGDGGSGGDPEDRAQNLGSRLGKILRIDPVDPDGGGPLTYRVPTDNPYRTQAGAKPEIWAFGLRNPWRGSVDRLTGSLVVGDVGQQKYEELDVTAPTGGDEVGGRAIDYGWDTCEGDRTYPGDVPCGHAAEGFEAPVYTYGHSGGGPMDGGCAIVGGYVYRGGASPDWQGVVFIGDTCSGKVGALTVGGDLLMLTSTGSTISSFGEDAAGRLYLADLRGRIRAITLSGDPLP